VSVFWRDKQPQQRSFAAVYPTVQSGGSYADVNLAAAETSLQAVAIRSCVDLICSLGSELPMDVFSGEGRDRQERTMPGYLKDPAGDGHGLEDWCYQVLESWALRGNLYGDILERSPTGKPMQISLHYPDDVSGWVEDGKVQWRVNGKPVDNARFLHQRVNPVPGRVKGLSPIEFHATTIGLEIVSTRFGVQWFKDGAHPTGLLSNTETDLNPEQAQIAKQRFLATIRGGREPLVYGKGWDFKPLSITAEESQFLKTQEYSAAECCRIFGPGFAEILGYETGGTMTYSNIESRSAHLLVYSMNKWLRRLERLLSSMLPNPQYVRIDRDALLQSTTLDRYKAHETALKNRWKVVNEVREDEDMKPVPWGNEPNPSGPQTPEEPSEPPVTGGNE
jgi:HK97 family phage portal protein